MQAQKGTADFPMFKDAGLIVGISVPTLGTWANKKIKALEQRAKTDAGAKAMIWVKVEDLARAKFDSSAKSKYSAAELGEWCAACGAKDGDLVCIFAGPAGKMADKTREVGRGHSQRTPNPSACTPHPGADLKNKRRPLVF